MAPLESVDNALRLILLLSTGDCYSVTDIARQLGVAPSTAHRLLSTMIQRDFAEQVSDRRYCAGPAMTRLRIDHDRQAGLVRAARTHLRLLAATTNETSHLVVLSGRDARFLASEEGLHALRIGSRAGQLMPAHLTAGGKVLLADLPDHDLARLYPDEGVEEAGLNAAGVSALNRELRAVRERGLAVNRGATERGLYAMAVAIRPDGGTAIASVVISLPMVRQSPGRTPELIAALQSAAVRIGAEVASSSGS
jgi:IclR family acetate operon transcriptional repressor